MDKTKGFVTLASLLTSALVGLGGIGSVMILANVKQLAPSDIWGRTKIQGDIYASVPEFVRDTIEIPWSPSPTPPQEDGEDASAPTGTPTLTPVSTLTPTPTPTQIASPTPTPVPKQDDDENEDENEEEKEHDGRTDKDEKKEQSRRAKARLSLKTQRDGWLKYKFMLFGKGDLD